MEKKKVKRVNLRNMNSPFLNVDEAAEYLKVKTSTIYNWVHNKKRTGIPVRYHGRKLVFLIEALMQWSDEQNGIVPKAS